jgi:membrane-associated protease RseP (regulator of RpoE activity)
MFNMMPIKPLDGGLMLETVVEKYFPNRLHVVNTVSLVGWTVILGTMALSLVVQFL